ncbi:ABC transporter permease subunit [Mycoplasma sp. SG1]|uniref:ABC transporter permease subunit n=1 Tax=Mycoplasma sp. SG1 TaxID=2810348 RepID=UPI002023D0A4|nr:ABC transporter permease subunit [Mycoplasma sp. SG1]URM52759.1 ABC transporter permease subunit [Mycoplasma sp. SG1]
MKKLKKLKKSSWFSTAFLLIMILFLYLPLLVVFIFSFNNSGQTWSFSGFSFGFKYYGDLFKQSLFLKAILVSILISLLSTFISTVIGTLAAISFQRLSKKSQAVIQFFNNIPLINADIIIGASLMILFISLAFSFGFLTLLAAHISFSVPYVTITVLAKLKSVNKHYLDASLDLGATPFYTIKKVIIPLIKNGIYAGAAIAFAMSIDDFIISYFTSGSLQNYSVYIYTMRHFQPFVNAFGVLLILFLVVLFIVFQSLTKIKSRKTKLALNNLTADNSKFLKVKNYFLKWFKITSKPILKSDNQVVEKKPKRPKTFLIKNKLLSRKVLSVFGLSSLSLGGVGLLIYYFVSNQKVISLAVWSEYFTDSSIRKWEDKTGWNVQLITYSSNEELSNKLNTASFDVMMPSDYFVSYLKASDLIQPLNSQYIEQLINKNNPSNDSTTMFEMVNDVYNRIPIDNSGDHLTSKNINDNQGYFFPAFIQNTQIISKKSEHNNLNPWLQLWNAIENGKNVIIQDDPRIVFTLGKVIIYLKKDQYKSYYNDCFSNIKDLSFINFSSPSCVKDVYDVIKGPFSQGTVSIHSDDIDTYLNNEKFDYALTYNSSFAESIKVRDITDKYQSQNAYLPTFLNSSNNVPINDDKSQTVNADGFVINKNLSQQKKALAENLISYLLSYNSGVDSTDNYSFSIPNNQIFEHFRKQYQQTEPAYFRSLFWLDSSFNNPQPNINGWINNVWKPQMFNLNAEVLDYNLNNEIANYYNLLLKS